MNELPNLHAGEPLARDCHGFRKTPDKCSPRELASMHAAENAVLRHARIANGVHPDYRNGYGPGFSRAECLHPGNPPVIDASRPGSVKLI